MTGFEELVRKGYYSGKGRRRLTPEGFGLFGILRLGDTTFNVLQSFLDLDLLAPDSFEPEHYHKPANIAQARPDELVTSGQSIVAVVEHKTPDLITEPIERRRALEQLHVYMLATKAKVGVLTDGSSFLWLHNLDPRRADELKLVTEDGQYCTRALSADNIRTVIDKLDAHTDELTTPPAFDPSQVARSIWQDVYIATRQDPEKCFQTFVELFMYKLVSDYALLPLHLTLNSLVEDAARFERERGEKQITYYLNTVRPRLKDLRFPELNTARELPALRRVRGEYQTTKQLIPTLDTSAGFTSIIDGHAFNTQPEDYNGAFVGILRKLNELPHIMSLDAGFKSRLYEQFLRRDPNTSKVTGKYFTPRNVVKSIVQMADVARLHPEATICDPACGVGGFLTETMLELQRNNISIFREENGRLAVSRKLLGLEVLHDIVCLAKANMLLHSIEQYNALTDDGKKAFNQLLADTFVHCHEDRTLGTLKHPVQDEIDLIMANPPYMVSGTRAISTKIREAGLNGFYDAGGSGLESRFINWIVNALKPGGRAFVVLPKSMLARVDEGVKAFIRRKCFVDALIYLPERTFYTTPAATYVLALTRKPEESAQQTSPVFCYYVRDIGETRDVDRAPTRNDLIPMVDEFRTFRALGDRYRPATGFVKVVSHEDVTPGRRWDVDHLWTPQELADLGVVDTNVLPVDAITAELLEVVQDLEEAKNEVAARVREAKQYMEVGLDDPEYFSVFRGERVTTAECNQHPGDVPVVASGRHTTSYLGTISEAYLRERELTVQERSERVLSVGATGAVGTVLLRREDKWFLHDDALGIEIAHPQLVPEYVRYELQRVVDAARFDYTAKLYSERLKALRIRVPVNEQGGVDVEMQQTIAEASQAKEGVRRRLRGLSELLQSVSVDFAD